jgi:hypothetical protein
VGSLVIGPLVVARAVVGGRIRGDGPSRPPGLCQIVVQVGHDVGEYRVIVHAVGRAPAFGTVHVRVVRSMNLADSSKIR